MVVYYSQLISMKGTESYSYSQLSFSSIKIEKGRKHDKKTTKENLKNVKVSTCYQGQSNGTITKARVLGLILDPQIFLFQMYFVSQKF
jgi:hypothetical protein